MMHDEKGNEVLGVLIGLLLPSSVGTPGGRVFQGILIGEDGCGTFGGAGGMGELILQLPAANSVPFTGTLKLYR
jgi:hypothetical protein